MSLKPSQTPVGIVGRPIQTSRPAAGVPIRVPSNQRNHQPTSFQQPVPPALEKLGDGEIVKIPDFQHDNTSLSPAEAEKALRELMSGGMNQELDSNIDIDISQEIVDGFKEGIKLLPHQILGRAWMRDREDLTKKRTGGILADDMGYCIFFSFFISLTSLIVLEKLYKR
jgi:hypothetical protein